MVNRKIKTAKQIDIQRQLDCVQGNPKLTWKIINSVLSRNHVKSNDEKLIQNFKATITSSDLPNAFAYTFHDGIRKIIHKCPVKFLLVVSINDPVQFSMRLPKISQTRLHDIVKGLNSRKSPGYDGIFLSDVRENENLLAQIRFALNSCITSGIFPECLKESIIKPAFKTGKKDDLANYRPIANLTTFDKIFEEHLNSEIIAYLERNTLLTPRQFGFRATKGTKDALVELTEYIHSNMDQNKYTLSVFIDFAKAFDTVDHGKLIVCLENIGIRGPILSLLNSYLSNRTSRVKIANTLSDTIQNTSGVTQGSKLGPTMFLISSNRERKR